MLREIVSEALTITGGENHALWYEEIAAKCAWDKRDRTRGAFLADELIRLTQDGTLDWGISDKKDLLVCVEGEVVLVARKIAVYMYYGPCYNYILSVFKGGREILSEKSALYGSYDDWSPRLPIMDLFDVVVDGGKRPVPPAHVCGLQGFGMGLSDRCPACDAEEERRKEREGKGR